MNTDGIMQLTMNYGTKVALIAIIIGLIVSIFKGKNLAHIVGFIICGGVGLYVISDPTRLEAIGKVLFESTVKIMEVIGNEITKA